MAETITRDTLIEDLVIRFPNAVQPLMAHGIKCIECGEPIWGTIGDAAVEKGLSESELETALNEINDLVDK